MREHAQFTRTGNGARDVRGRWHLDAVDVAGEERRSVDAGLRLDQVEQLPVRVRRAREIPAKGAHHIVQALRVVRFFTDEHVEQQSGGLSDELHASSGASGAL